MLQSGTSAQTQCGLARCSRRGAAAGRPAWAAAVLLVSLAAVPGPATAQTWTISTVDSTADVGWYTDMVMLPSGSPAISYYNVTAQDLRYAWSDGTSWQATTVDAPGSVGPYTSMIVLPSGHPAISYYDSSLNRLKYASFNGTAWTITQPDPIASGGSYTSLARQPSGHPAISFFGNGQLKYVRHDGSAWIASVVDPVTTTGRYTSLAFLPNGQPAISYQAVTSGDLKYAWFDGVAWQRVTIESTGVSGYYTSLAILPNGNPAISFFNQTAGQLKFAEWDGGQWTITVVDSAFGFGTSLAIMPDGEPAITYQTSTTGPLRYGKRSGGVWTLQTVETGNVGWYSSLAYVPEGEPAIAYYAGGQLKYAKVSVLRRYVRASAPAGGNGQTWAEAYNNLQTGINNTPSGGELRVAAGTYVPAGLVSDPATAFRVFKVGSFSMFGGFPSTGGTWWDRDPTTHVSRLSGERGGSDYVDNCQHVLRLEIGNPALIDGFEITRGSADGQFGRDDAGGGVLARDAGNSFTLRNCVITDNRAGYRPVGGSESTSGFGAGMACINTPGVTIENCTFRGNRIEQGFWTASRGGALYVRECQPIVRNCLFEDNLLFALESSDSYGGALYLDQAAGTLIEGSQFIRNACFSSGGAILGDDLTVRACDFQGNGGEGALVGSNLTVESSDFVANSHPQQCLDPPYDWYDCGPGTGELLTSNSHLQDVSLEVPASYGPTLVGGSAAGLTTVAGVLVLVRGTYNMTGTVAGTGTIRVDRDATLRVHAGGLIDLSGSSPGTGCADVDTSDSWGLLEVHGTLLLDNGVVQNTRVAVFAGDWTQGEIFNNRIDLLNPGGWGGEFFVQGLSTVQCNVIRSEGDRYLDLDPDPDVLPRPVVLDNFIHVTIKQGVGLDQGELLELRSEDRDIGLGGGTSGAYELPSSIGYDDTWALQELAVEAGAKVNLTNRPGFIFQDPNIPNPEALYVKKVVLHADSVLNTGLQRLYYQELVDPNGVPLERDPLDPSAPMANGSRIVDVPVLGFSLKNIAMEDDTEFSVRVRSRLRDPLDVSLDPPEPEDPNNAHLFHVGAVLRMADPLDADNSVMQICSLAAGRQPARSVAAHGAFARAGEDEISVVFEYRFTQLSSDPGLPTELIVYLSDSPDVGLNRVEVARVRPPVAGRPGSIGSSQRAIFYGVYPKGALNFRRGTYVELELVGRDACIEIDNWDPRIECLNCADLNGSVGVDSLDYLVLVSETGGVVPPFSEDGRAWCFDNGLNDDKYVDLQDLLSWDTLLNNPDLLNACSGGLSPLLSEPPAPGSVTLPPGPGLLLSAKPAAPITPGQWETQFDDRLYPLDLTGQCSGTPQPPASVPSPQGSRRGNGRLVQDGAGEIYQLHGTQGLIRLSDAQAVIPPGVKSYGGRTVYVGPYATGGGSFVGFPVEDVAFNPADPDVAYVVPVAVEESGSPRYRAAAKLQLGANGSYSLTAIYGVNPYIDPRVTFNSGEGLFEPDFQRQREIEVDGQGNVYVLSAHGFGQNNFVLLYDAAGVERVVSLDGLSFGTVTTAGIDTSGLGSLLASQAQPDTLYLMSGLAGSASAWPQVLRFGIQRAGGTATGLSYADAITIDHTSTCTDDVGFGCRALLTSIAEHPDGRLFVSGFTTPIVPAEVSLDSPLYQQLYSDGSPITAGPTLAIIPAGQSSGSVNAADLPCTGPSLPVSVLVRSGPAVCAGDADGDGDIDLDDLLLVLGSFGQPGPNSAGDTDDDGDTDLDDLLLVLGSFGGSC